MTLHGDSLDGFKFWQLNFDELCLFSMNTAGHGEMARPFQLSSPSSALFATSHWADLKVWTNLNQKSAVFLLANFGGFDDFDDWLVLKNCCQNLSFFPQEISGADGQTTDAVIWVITDIPSLEDESGNPQWLNLGNQSTAKWRHKPRVQTYTFQDNMKYV